VADVDGVCRESTWAEGKKHIILRREAIGDPAIGMRYVSAPVI
jgi:hypothetical protein